MQKRKNISLKEKKITSLKKSTQKGLGYLDDSPLRSPEFGTPKVLMTNTVSFFVGPNVQLSFPLEN